MCVGVWVKGGVTGGSCAGGGGFGVNVTVLKGLTDVTHVRWLNFRILAFLVVILNYLFISNPED